MRTLLLALLVLCLPLAAAEKKAKAPQTPPIPEKPEDIAAEIGELLTEEPSGGPTGKKAVQAMWKTRLARVDALIAAFRQKFADHPLRWDVLYWEANSNDVRAEIALPKLAGVKPALEVYAEVAAATDANPEIRIRASFDRVSLLTEEVLEQKLPFADWEKALTEHLARFPDYGGNHILLEQRARFLRKFEPARLVPYLEELAKSTNPETSEMAAKQLAIVKARDELKAKPFVLQFKATNGADVDLEKLRGKVVLLYFWASWSEPSIAQIPVIQQLHGKFGESGLTVISVSLDDNAKDLAAAVKKKKITWPTYFDGKGFESPLTKPYGLDELPALWLINKQGHLTDFEAEQDTPAKIQKLLTE
jgi:thiol-disulfide isomerase/thioredoxin